MTDTNHETTYDAMQAVLRDLGVIEKTRQTESRNADFRFRFRGIEELLEAVNPLCKKHGLLTPPVMTGEPIVSGYTTGGGSQMHWVMVPTAIHFQAAPDDIIVGGPFLGEAADSGDKAATKAQSVAWREIMFKTFSCPTRGEDYDTEPDSEGKAAASDAEIAAAAKEVRDADAKALGWENAEEFDGYWDDLREACNGESQSAQWARGWVKAHEIKKGTFTPGHAQEIGVVLGNAKKDGDWKANYTPPEVGDA